MQVKVTVRRQDGSLEVLEIVSIDTLSGSVVTQPIDPIPAPTSSLPPPVVVTSGSHALGFNVDKIYAQEFGFANKMRMHRPWVSATWNVWDDGRALGLDSNGQVTSLQPGQHAVTIVPTHGLTERFVVTWQGSGSIIVSDVGSTVVNQANRIEVMGSPTNVELQLRVISAPVSGVQVRRASESATASWDKDFLAALSGSRCIRTMQWSDTNGDDVTPDTTWASRLRSNFISQRPKVAWEHHISLANAANSDLWINVPHLADDAYCRSLGALVSGSLKPGLRCYVELSNEVWNSSFRQNAWFVQQGTALGLDPNPLYAAMKFQGLRSTQVWSAFEAGYGRRCVRVIAGQGGWSSLHDRIFSQIPAGGADVFATFAYFGGWSVSETNYTLVGGLTVDGVLDEMEQRLAADTFTEIDGAAATAKKYGVRLVAYEGGQHLVVNGNHNTSDPTLVAKFADCNRNPRMYGIYKRVLDYWVSAGGELFNHYTLAGTWNHFGSWGSKERTDQSIATAHKYRALKDWAAGV